MVKCCVQNCKQSKHHAAELKDVVKITFHGMPTLPSRHEIWTAALRKINGEEWTPSKTNCFVCSRHFHDGNYDVKMDGKRTLKYNAFPNIFLPLVGEKRKMWVSGENNELSKRRTRSSGLSSYQDHSYFASYPKTIASASSSITPVITSVSSQASENPHYTPDIKLEVEEDLDGKCGEDEQWIMELPSQNLHCTSDKGFVTDILEDEFKLEINYMDDCENDLPPICDDDQSDEIERHSEVTITNGNMNFVSGSENVMDSSTTTGKVVKLQEKEKDKQVEGISRRNIEKDHRYATNTNSKIKLEVRNNVNEVQNHVNEAQNHVNEAQNNINEAQNNVNEVQNNVNEAPNNVNEAPNNVNEEAKTLEKNKILQSKKTLEFYANENSKLAAENRRLQERLSKLNVIGDRIVKENSSLKMRVKKLHDENHKLIEGRKQVENAVSDLFHPDQLLALTRNSTRGMKWSQKTLREAAILYKKCRTDGYNFIRQRYPYPSVRILQRSKIFDTISELPESEAGND